MNKYLVQITWGRILLHMGCLVRRPSHYRWHCQGIRRELVGCKSCFRVKARITAISNDFISAAATRATAPASAPLWQQGGCSPLKS